MGDAPASTRGEVILRAFPKAQHEPSPSGFCQKLETFLRATSTPYTQEATYPHTSPTSKLPCAVIRGDIVADSHVIIRRLIGDGISRDLYAGLTAAQQAESRAWQVYVEDCLYPRVVYERWCIDANYASMAKELATGLPWPVSWVLPWYFRRRIRGALSAQGVGRREPSEVQAMLVQAIKDLETRLATVSDNGYFFPSRGLSELDVIVGGFMMNILGCQGNPWASAAILDSPRLLGLTRRLTQSLFPEYQKLVHVMGG